MKGLHQTGCGNCLTAGKKRKILVVDDDRHILRCLSDLFSFFGYVVTIAHSGEDALSRLSKSQFDLVITDLIMPGMDGWTLARHIKQASPITPVILLTGEKGVRTTGRAEEDFVDLVLFKPIGIKVIREALQKLTDRLTKDSPTEAVVGSTTCLHNEQ